MSSSRLYVPVTCTLPVGFTCSTLKVLVVSAFWSHACSLLEEGGANVGRALALQ